MLSVESWSGQRVSEGQLGCPVCHARYPIRRGAVDFGGGSHDVRHAPNSAPADAMRLAAQLSLTEAGGILLLTGPYAACADMLAEFADVTCLLVDAAPGLSETAVHIHVSERLPLVDRALRGAAVTESHNEPAFVAEVARCVRPGGRIVAPARMAVPIGSRLIARDDREWVVEMEGSSAPIPLRRAQPG